MRLIRNLVCFFIGMVVLNSLAYASSDHPPKISNDHNIVAFLIVVNKHEIAAAEIALDKEVPAIVSEYANWLKDDHSTNLSETRKLIFRTGIIPLKSWDVIQLKEKAEDERDMLSKLEGIKFAKAYIDAMVADHKDALNTIDKVTPIVSNELLKAHIRMTRPHVMEHLKRALIIKGELDRQ